MLRTGDFCVSYLYYEEQQKKVKMNERNQENERHRAAFGSWTENKLPFAGTCQILTRALNDAHAFTKLHLVNSLISVSGRCSFVVFYFDANEFNNITNMTAFPFRLLMHICVSVFDTAIPRIIFISIHQ